jgi:hypothetical protein
VLLEEVFLQSGVGFLVVWMDNNIETELDDLAEGGNCVVEPVPPL